MYKNTRTDSNNPNAYHDDDFNIFLIIMTRSRRSPIHNATISFPEYPVNPMRSLGVGPYTRTLRFRRASGKSPLVGVPRP